jgi:hypothetical protein
VLLREKLALHTANLPLSYITTIVYRPGEKKTEEKYEENVLIRSRNKYRSTETQTQNARNPQERTYLESQHAQWTFSGFVSLQNAFCLGAADSKTMT